MEKESLVLTAGWNIHSILKTARVSILPLTSSYTVSFLFLTQYIYISAGKREIKNLPVKCDNVERGCEWEGIIGTLDEHVAVCKFTPVPCPNQCKENDKIVLLMRKDIDHHMCNECPNRDYVCEYCGENGMYSDITQIHDKKCEKKVIPCTNTECTKTIERGKMKSHLENDCKYTIISCKYNNIGCNVELKRKDVRSHEEDSSIHFHHLLGAVIKLQDNLQSANDTIATQQDEIATLRGDVKLANNTIVAQQVEVVSLQGEVKSAHDTIAAQKGEVATLRDEVKSANDTIVALKSEVIILRGEVKSAKNTIVALNSKVSKWQGNTLGKEKSLTFKLTGFEKLKKSNSVFRSPSFYTSPEGYHLEVVVYANGFGDGKGTHVSVYLRALKGEHDDTLKWPFTEAVTFQVLNQLKDGNHHSLSTQSNSLNVGYTWGYCKYISHSKLDHDTSNNTEYLKNDTLYFRVLLKLSDHKPWLECIMK